ncbi:HNH endonuclease [Brevibacillus reuszeri]|uniref:HNH endonuclease n=1 Tax=Brevibacillus reuszeri TaxID=54915 RepID=UPI003D20CFC5
MKNAFEVRGEVTVIFLKYKDCTIEALISTKRLEKLKEYRGTFHAKRCQSTNKFYVRGDVRESGKKKSILLHRFITNALPGEEVDHINHNPLNNTDDNLRKVSGAQNSQNRDGPNKNGTSGYRGVSWHKRIGKWQCSFMLNGKHHHVGYFEELEQAIEAIKKARAINMPFSTEAIETREKDDR